MEILPIIQGLRIRKEKVERAIALLEDLVKDSGGAPFAGRKRRGRKSMGPEERKKVSARIRKYWKDRRDNGVGRAGSEAASES